MSCQVRPAASGAVEERADHVALQASFDLADALALGEASLDVSHDRDRSELLGALGASPSGLNRSGANSPSGSPLRRCRSCRGL